MTTKSQVEQPSRYSSLRKHACPTCRGDLFRIPRRSIERVMSLFVPVQRFRCHFFSCHWEGNIRVTRQESFVSQAAADSANAMGHRSRVDSPSRRVPKSFVVHLALAAAGLVAVVVFSTTDVLSDAEATSADRRDEQWRAAPKLADQGTKIGRTSQAPAR